jgi:hypothetical protein
MAEKSTKSTQVLVDRPSWHPERSHKTAARRQVTHMQGWKDFFMAGSLSGCFERCSMKRRTRASYSCCLKPHKGEDHHESNPSNDRPL